MGRSYFRDCPREELYILLLFDLFFPLSDIVLLERIKKDLMSLVEVRKEGKKGRVSREGRREGRGIGAVLFVLPT